MINFTSDDQIKFPGPPPPRPIVPPEKGFYVSGFVDGEGSFYTTARKRSDYPTGWKFSANFNVGNKDKSTIDLCRDCIGCGFVRESKKDFFVLEVADRKYLQNLVIPFFKDYPFFTTKKSLEFDVFQKLVSRIDGGIYTYEALEEYLDLRRQLDTYRQSKSQNTDEIIRSTFKPQPDL